MLKYSNGNLVYDAFIYPKLNRVGVFKSKSYSISDQIHSSLTMDRFVGKFWKKKFEWSKIHQWINLLLDIRSHTKCSIESKKSLSSIRKLYRYNMMNEWKVFSLFCFSSFPCKTFPFVDKTFNPSCAHMLW